jgi:glyoxylase-like metal-dependent hydrolase (beta-lactamase superfamily II)
MYSPGHSPGHLTFWWAERRFLIAGDGIATWANLCAG